MSPQPSSSEPTDDWPWISVIITTYDLSRYDDFCECVDSVLTQQYDAFDIILVTETDEVQNAVTRDYGAEDCVNITHLEDGGNLATARNAGAHAATGDVVAFIDDDCIADDDWLAELARGYQESDLDAVGGKATPIWPTQTCWYLPEEFYWLVGATHSGFADGEGEVRNTFGCNISFRREAFIELDGFSPNLGKDHGHNLQGEETDLCARIRAERGGGLYYVPTAEVQHKVYEEQTSLRWLVDRAFWQGVTKSIVGKSADDATDEEWGFLGYLVRRAMPAYLRSVVTLNPRSLVQFVMLLVFTVAVGVGFVYGMFLR